MKKFIRMTAMFLVCLVLINSMLIPAKAIVLEAAAGYVAVSGLELAISVLVGLGLTIEIVDYAVGWDNLVSSTVDYFSTSGWANSDGDVTIYQSDIGIGFVPLRLLQDIKDWLFESNSIQSISSVASPSTFFIGNTSLELVTCSSPVYYGYFFTNRSGSASYNYYTCVFSSSPFTFKFTSSSSILNPGSSNGIYLYSIGSGTVSKPPSYAIYLPLTTETYDYTLLYSYFSSNYRGYVSPLGIAFADIPPLPGTTIETNYEEWADSVIIIAPNGLPEQDPEGNPEEEPDPIPYLPIRLPAPGEVWGPGTLPNQPDIWRGNDPQTPQEDPTQEPSPDNPSNGGGTPPSFPDMVIDLTDFFPFCIPFDIYEFLKLLSADPVAPEFDWKLFGFDREFTFHIDLSAFDDLAALVRAFELLGFVIGLGILTRDKFLRG